MKVQEGRVSLSIYILFFRKKGVAGVAGTENAVVQGVLPRYAQVENGRSRRSRARSRHKKTPANGRGLRLGERLENIVNIVVLPLLCLHWFRSLPEPAHTASA